VKELINKIIAQIDKEKVEFIYLIGSYASNSHNEFSDLDIIIALKEGYESYRENKYIDNVYVSLTYDSKAETKKNYSDPLKYIKGHNGIVEMVPLYDKDNQLIMFKEKCLAVNYLKDLNEAINHYVNDEVVGWIEEVNKACSGYFNNNYTKMLEGLHGLTYGMLDVLAVSEGLVIMKEGFLETYKNYFQENSSYNLLKRALGIKETTLINRVVDGLMFYTDLIQIIEYRFTAETKRNVDLAIKNILKVFNEVSK